MPRIHPLTAPLFAVPLLLASVTVQAMPIVQTATCVDTTNECATGITGLDVAGTLFDVDFVSGSSYDAVYASDAPYFLGDPSGAEAARDAIIAAFGSDIYGAVGEGSQQSVFLIPHDSSSGLNSGAIAISPAGSTFWGGGGYSLGNSLDVGSFEPEQYWSYTLFTEATTVPAPATLLLFGLGLAGIGFGMRRR